MALRPAEPVEVWIGASAPPAIDRAARLAEGWIASPGLTRAEARAQADFYRERCAAYGRQPNAVALRRDIYIGQSSSEAQAVLRHAECSVEIVREAPKKRASEAGAFRLLAATDGSEHAEATIRSIAERPWPTGTEICVVSVPELPLIAGPYPYYPPEVLSEAAKTNEDHAKDAVQKGVRALKKVGLCVSGEATEAQESPVRGILGKADSWGANLIVLGSHGRRGFDRYVMGSVSEAVALHAHCSVEVVRTKASKQENRSSK